MNPDYGRFDRITKEQADALQGYIDRGESEETGLADAHRRHGLKQAQVFRVGDAIELKGALYRVKSIHTKSLVLAPLYP